MHKVLICISWLWNWFVLEMSCYINNYNKIGKAEFARGAWLEKTLG